MKNNLGNKETMAENIKALMARHNKTASDVCLALNIPKATFSNWCNAVSYPRIDKIELLADFFGVSKAELVEERHASYYIDKEAAELAEFLKTNPGHRVLFDASRNVKPEDIEKIAAMIKLLSQ